jgi:hypothetical protein
MVVPVGIYNGDYPQNPSPVPSWSTIVAWQLTCYYVTDDKARS